MSLFAKPDPLPTGQEVEAIAVAMAAAVGLTYHTLDEENRFRVRVMASACLVRQGVEDKRALGDQVLMRQLDGVAEAAEIVVKALDEGHDVTDEMVIHLQRSASVARTLRAIVFAADLPEVDSDPVVSQVYVSQAERPAPIAPPCDVCGQPGKWFGPLPGSPYALACCPAHVPPEPEAEIIHAEARFRPAVAAPDPEDEVIV